MSDAASNAPGPNIGINACVEVVVLGGTPGEYTYVLPDSFREGAVAGRRVEVPFRSQPRVGILVGPGTAPPGVKLLPVTRLLDDGPLLIPPVLELCRWAAGYYGCALSVALKPALPPGAEGEDETGWELSPKGAALLASPQAMRPVDRQMLQAVAEGRWDLLAPGAQERLRRDGLLQRTHLLHPKAQAPMVTVAVRAGPDHNPVPTHHRVRHAIYAALLDRSPLPVETLAGLGVSARTAVQQMAEKGLVQLQQVPRAALVAALPRDGGGPPATEGQQAALEMLVAALEAGKSETYLLEGVTGSGKTEVYLRLIDRALSLGGQALVMVPEIALTPQLAARFAGRFGERVAVLHSGLTEKERASEWHRIHRGEAPIVVGARSALFAPLTRLRVLVVDEEHDGSFKQGSGLRYQGRDLAVVRGRAAGAVVVLGSATPSLESLHNVARGRYRHLHLPHRVVDRPMPEVQLVDLRGRLRGRPENGIAPSGLLSDQALDALRETVARGEQAIVFLNRRGHSTALLCRDCGEVARCTSCAVALTHHAAQGILVCHYCGRREPEPPHCLHCRSTRLLFTGAGTQKLADELEAALPEARLCRLDRDSAPTGRALESVLGKFSRREIDILVGTQMVAKGHDFPGVTLVVVALADAALHQPDFRSGERTAQLLVQVAGRAGRGALPGRVLVQCFTPDAPAIAAVAGHDYAAFARSELAERESVGYPPLRRLALIRAEGADEAHVRAALEETARALRAIPGIDLLGPAPAPLVRLRDRYRYQLLLKSAHHAPLVEAARRVAEMEPRLPSGVDITSDIDPVDLL